MRTIAAVRSLLACRPAPCQHHVRLESLKLFELSPLDSSLARGKNPWKPLDPYLEIPVLSEVVKVPRRPDVIRQRSIIFLSAVVVPTAADLAAIPFNEDVYAHIQDGRPRPLHSFARISPDLREAVTSYH